MIMFNNLALFLVIGLLPFFVREFRKNSQITMAYWFVIALHQTVAFTNVFLFGTIGATGDAQRFHGIAVTLAQSGEFNFSTGMVLYNNTLGVIYWLFGSSHFLGEQFSILAFAISCIVLIKIMGLLELPRYRVSALLIFGALPSMVFFGSVTLREPYQVLFFMIAVYFGFLMSARRGGLAYCLPMFLSIIFIGILHKGLVIFAFYLLILFIVWTPYRGPGLLSLSKRRLTILLIILPLLTSFLYIEESKYLHIVLFELFFNGDGIFEIIEQFRENFSTRETLVNARAAYFVDLDFSSIFAIVGTFFSLLIHFLFAPFPWQVKNILDVYASMESILRLVLIYCSVRHWQNAYGVKRQQLGLLLLLFFSMSFLWSIGTSNYGTAARHNTVAWWILVVAGTPFLMKTLNRIRLP
jgi:hypothetical protein